MSMPIIIDRFLKRNVGIYVWNHTEICMPVIFLRVICAETWN
jgi:hypothetical protein